VTIVHKKSNRQEQRAKLFRLKAGAYKIVEINVVPSFEGEDSFDVFAGALKIRGVIEYKDRGNTTRRTAFAGTYAEGGGFIRSEDEEENYVD
jgi:hypothetical protein